MITKNLPLLLMTFVLSLVLTSCQDSANQQKTEAKDPVLSSIQLHTDSLLQDAKIAAVSIGIYKDGKEYIEHFGELDEGKGNKPTDKTIYEIASVSKTFAGTLVAHAELDGKLNLEDDISKYFEEDYPNLAYDDQPIRIKHLITHTSRLPRFLPEKINTLLANIDESTPFKLYDAQKDYDKPQFYEDLKGVTLDTIPGVRYEYSNVNTEIIAHIMEVIYNKSYEDLLKEHVFDKAGMPNTKINLSEIEKKYLATGYGETRKVVPHLVNPLWGSGGGVKSTLPDLLNYMKYQLDEKNVVVQKSHEVVFENESRTMGYYWPINTDEEDGTYYGHHGGAMGTQNWFFVFPKHNIGFSIITNQSDQETAGKLIKTVSSILDDIR